MTADAERLAAIRADLNVRVPAIDLKDRDAARNLLEIARELLAERDALRARINAARWAYINTASRFEAAAKMNAALAGDQPEATPEPVRCGQDVRGTVPSWAGQDQIDPCSCVRPQGHDEGCACAHQEPSDAVPEATPDPPHLDPEPWVGSNGQRWPRQTYKDDRFDPRPADENGKAYSDNIEHYKEKHAQS